VAQAERFDTLRKMTQPPPSEHRLDFAALPLPSDRVTLGMLRRRQPTVFDRLSDWRIPADLLEILATVHLENIVARRAFAAECKQPDPLPTEDRRELIRMLNDDYQRYGISSGMQETRQLIRDLEAAARQQARHLGRAV
jgi:hypothetical protein